MASVVEDAGHHAIVAGRLDAIRPDSTWDIVVSDLLPLRRWDEAEARQWVNRVRERCGCCVIVCSAHLPPGVDHSILGADAVVRKPFDIQTLLEKIELLTAS